MGPGHKAEKVTEFWMFYQSLICFEIKNSVTFSALWAEPNFVYKSIYFCIYKSIDVYTKVYTFVYTSSHRSIWDGQDGDALLEKTYFL